MTEEIPTLQAWPPPIDDRFGLAVQPQPTDSWMLALWCVDDGGEVALVYGWAIPRPFAGTSWQSFGVLKDGKARLTRVTLSHDFATVSSVIAGLCRGDTLLAAATKAKAPPPTNLPCASLRLAWDEEPVSAFYAPTPWCFMPIGDDIGFRSSHARPRPSPNPDAPAVGTALLARSKELLAARPPLAAPGRLGKVLEALERETGLTFTLEDAARFGDLEVFLFPAAHANERSRVHITLRSRSPVVTLDDVPSGTEVLVRCTQELAGLVLADETRRVLGQAGATEVRFSGAADGPHVTTVEVWAGSGDAPRGLWFRNIVAPMRHLQGTMSLVTADDVLDSAWLGRWAGHRKMRDSVEELRRVRRVHTERPFSVGERDASFVEAAQASRAWGAKWRPKPSGAKLFEKGDRLEFAKWLREELGRSRGVSRVVLVDPFFDEWGVEMFARVQDTSCSFEVVTALERPGGEEATLDKLQNACKELALMLEGIRLTIYALRGNPRPIHDRLLLALAGDDPVRGAHLSNSLSGAASQHPLLVTVIGDDVLQGVADYVARSIPEDAGKIAVIRPSELAARAAAAAACPVEPTLSLEELAERVLAAAEANRAETWSDFATKLAHRDASHEAFDRFAAQAPPPFLAWLGRWLTTEGPKALGGPIVRGAIAVLTPYTSTFVKVADKAGHYVDFYDERIGPVWSVRYGWPLLAKAAPTLFVSTIDDVVASMPASDALLVDRGPYGALLAAATACIVEMLSRRPPAPLLAALLAAKTDFLRALSAAAVGAAVLQPDVAYRMPAGEALRLVDALSPDRTEERLVAVAEWIGDLRVRANQRGRRETTLRVSFDER